MSQDVSTPGPSHRLTGWKEIGQYLGKSARTVQRWEQHLELPIQRIRTSSDGQIVFADKSEIDKWLQRQSSAVLAAAEHASQTEPDNAAPSITPASANARPPHSRGHRLGVVVTATVGLLLIFWSGIEPRHEPPANQIGSHHARTAVVYAVLERGLAVIDEAAGRQVRDIPVAMDAAFASLGPSRTFPGDSVALVVTNQPSGVVEFNLDNEQWQAWRQLPGRRIKAGVRGHNTVGLVDQDGFFHIFEGNNIAPSRAVAIPTQAFDGFYDSVTARFLSVNRDHGTMSVIADGAVAQEISVGESAGRVAIATDRRQAYLTNHYHSRLTCLDLESSEVKSTRVGDHPWELALSPDGRWVFVANRDDATVSVVDAKTCRTVNTIPRVSGFNQVGEVAVGMAGARLYLANDASGLAIFDIRNLPTQVRHIGTLALPGTISGLVPSLESQQVTSITQIARLK